MKKPTHGGARKGAGRKKKVDKYVSVGIYEDTAESFARGKKLMNNTELINNAIMYYIGHSDLFLK